MIATPLTKVLHLLCAIVFAPAGLDSLVVLTNVDTSTAFVNIKDLSLCVRLDHSICRSEYHIPQFARFVIQLRETVDVFGGLRGNGDAGVGKTKPTVCGHREQANGGVDDGVVGRQRTQSRSNLGETCRHHY